MIQLSVIIMQLHDACHEAYHFIDKPSTIISHFHLQTTHQQ